MLTSDQEMRALVQLAYHYNELVTDEALIRTIFGDRRTELRNETKTLAVIVSRLRRKIGPVWTISRTFGIGYTLMVRNG